MARSSPRAPSSVPPPTPIQSCLDRLAADDPSARSELIAACRDRVRLIVGRVLAGYPSLRPERYLEDVEQDALVRLSRTLEAVTIRTTVHFLRLAARQVRRAVLDLIRRDFPRWADGRVVYPLHERLPSGQTPAVKDTAPGRLELFDLLDRLDEWERGAIDCVHLLGMSRAETAAAYEVDERTITRWLASAKLRLAALLGIAAEANPE